MGWNELNSSITISVVQNMMTGSASIVVPPALFYITLETVPPQNLSFYLGDDSGYSRLVTVTGVLGVSDSDTTGYQFKVWGNVDETYDTDIQSTEQTSSWKSYNTSFSVKLISGNGSRTVSIKVRDDVGNETEVQSYNITLDTIIPVSTIMNVPQSPKLSAVVGYRSVDFSWQGNEIFTEYSLRVVPNSTSTYEEGVQIPDTYGSLNVNNTGEFSADNQIISRIFTEDLKLIADDGVITIKVFTKDRAGNWSD